VRPPIITVIAALRHSLVKGIEPPPTFLRACGYDESRCRGAARTIFCYAWRVHSIMK
jgi:hypothetical protein